MYLKNGRIIVLVGQEPRGGQLPVFVLQAVLDLREPEHGVELTGVLANDLMNGVTAGLVPCSDEQWERITRWSNRGDFITLTDKYRFGFITQEEAMRNGYITTDDLAWIAAITDVSMLEYERETKIESIIK